MQNSYFLFVVVLTSWSRDALELDSASSCVLIFHTLPCMSLLLLTLLLEERCHTRQRNVVSIEIREQSGVHIRDVEFDVDLLIECSFTLRGEIASGKRVEHVVRLVNCG